MRFWKCGIMNDDGTILNYCIGDRLEDNTGKEINTGIKYNGWNFTLINLI